MESSAQSNLTTLPEETSEDTRNDANAADVTGDERPSAFSSLPARPPIQ